MFGCGIICVNKTRATSDESKVAIETDKLEVKRTKYDFSVYIGTYATV